MVFNFNAVFQKLKQSFLIAFLLLFFSGNSFAQITKHIADYDEYLFCIITQETKRKKLNEMQHELKAWGFDLIFGDLEFDMNDGVKSIELTVKTNDGYSGTATMSDNHPIVYFYRLYDNAKKPFDVEAGNANMNIPGAIKEKIMRRGGGYEYAFNPEEDQKFSPTRIMGQDTDHKIPVGLAAPLIMLDEKLITEEVYLKMIRDDYPMREAFIEKNEAIMKYGDKAVGGVIYLSTIE